MKTKTPFLSLFVPSLPWFQALFEKASKENPSFSAWLVELVVRHWIEQGDLLSEEIKVWEQRLKRKQIKRTFKNNAVRNRLYVYLPQSCPWIRDLLNSMRKEGTISSISSHIWNLFLKEINVRLTPEQISDWQKYLSAKNNS